jgi:hypothetical protein
MGKKTRAIKKTDKEKDWNRRQNIARPMRDIAIKNTFLIYCEGENTEPEYFKSFPVTTETKVEAIGLGSSKTALIEKILKLVEDKREDNQEIWAVFDRDVNYTNRKDGDKDFDNAIKLAEKNNIKCAYSNDCFELWFILHEKFHQAALHRNQYYEWLSLRLGLNYEKDGKGIEFAKSLYQIFESKIGIAIQNAKNLHETHKHINPCEQNPCTTVYKLVESLKKNLRK